jgi:anti-sigma B factor antagonist
MGAAIDLDAGARSAGGRKVAYLVVAGEVDLANADELRAAVRRCADGGGDGVVIDLAGVSFMDSSGLAVLLEASRDLGPGLMVVTAPGSSVQRLLELTEAAEWVNRVSSEDEALSALAGTDEA